MEICSPVAIGSHLTTSSYRKQQKGIRNAAVHVKMTDVGLKSKNGFWKLFPGRDKEKPINWDQTDKKYTKITENGMCNSKNHKTRITVGPPKQERYHVNELMNNNCVIKDAAEKQTFVGRRDVLNPKTIEEQRIVSSKGTIRGHKNRVKAGIATFLDQLNSNGKDDTDEKNYRECEQGKIVLYSTSMAVVRETRDRCKAAKMILQTHMVKYDEIDLCMSRENQKEIMHRLGTTNPDVRLPQIFADGVLLGSLEQLEALNETGELRKIFQNFTHIAAHSSCTNCGGYRYTPCGTCHGSKKSLHRNNFTEEFCALRCMTCDENGLVRCGECSDQQG